MYISRQGGEDTDFTNWHKQMRAMSRELNAETLRAQSYAERAKQLNEEKPVLWLASLSSLCVSRRTQRLRV